MRDFFYLCFHYLNVNCPSRCIISLILPISMHNFFDFAYASSWDNSHYPSQICIEMGKTLRNIMHRDGQNSAKYHASIKIHIIFDKYLIRAQMKWLGGQICFTIIPDSLIGDNRPHSLWKHLAANFWTIFFSVTLCAMGIECNTKKKSVFGRKKFSWSLILGEVRHMQKYSRLR